MNNNEAKYHPVFKLKEGDIFPERKFKNQFGKESQWKDYHSKYLIVFFYPQDDTPTCTKEACGLRDHFDILKEHECSIIGISPDDEKSHQKFIEKHQLNFDLWVDQDHQFADELGIWGLKFMFGREYFGLHRVTYILNSEYNGMLSLL